jgi:hypothetical protein
MTSLGIGGGARQRLLAAAGLVLLAACSSSPGGSSLPDAAGAADRPAGGDADAAAEAPGPVDRAADLSAPASPEEICRTAIAVQCQRRITCEPMGSPSLAMCVSNNAGSCPDYYFNDASRRTPAGIAACLDALSRVACTDVAIGLQPDCLARGSRPGGAPCAYPSQCESAGCDVSATGCGVCLAAAASGAPCGTSALGFCPAGEFCHRTTRVCTPGSAVSHASVGQACDLSADPVVGCAGDLVCVIATPLGTAGTCVSLPGLDQPCVSGSSAAFCAAGLVCTSGVCRPEVPCGAASCQEGTYCLEADGGMTCAPRAVAGQACSSFQPAESPPCAAPATCTASPDAGYSCVRPGARGDACDTTRPCLGALTCTGGRCATPGPAACPLGVPDAAAGG